MKILFYYFLIFSCFFQYSVKAGDLPSGDNGVSGPLDFDSKGDVERLYSLNRVSEENTWIVEPIESFNPLKPQIFID